MTASAPCRRHPRPAAVVARVSTRDRLDSSSRGLRIKAAARSQNIVFQASQPGIPNLRLARDIQGSRRPLLAEAWVPTPGPQRTSAVAVGHRRPPRARGTALVQRFPQHPSEGSIHAPRPSRLPVDARRHPGRASRCAVRHAQRCCSDEATVSRAQRRCADGGRHARCQTPERKQPRLVRRHRSHMGQLGAEAAGGGRSRWQPSRMFIARQPPSHLDAALLRTGGSMRFNLGQRAVQVTAGGRPIGHVAWRTSVQPRRSAGKLGQAPPRPSKRQARGAGSLFAAASRPCRRRWFRAAAGR